MMKGHLQIIVLGYMVRGPLGGLAWHHLQYVMGLARLGHDVYFVEDSDDYPSCYDPSRHLTDANPTYGLRFTERVFESVGLGNRWAYYDAHTTRWLGPCASRIPLIAATADLLLNLSGMNPLRPWFMEIPARAFVDTDPAFTQIRHLTDPAARLRASQHTAFFSFGANIGLRHATVPEDGFPWQATRQPIVLDVWQVTPGPVYGQFTTVMQWESYPAILYNGCRYGMKADAFEPYIDLPAKAGSIFELALGSASAPRARLHDKGWRVCDPLQITRNLWTYQRYLQQSKAEFGVAKQGYVVSHSGWFSERSAAYLASGRPVLIQETGFSDWLSAGAGVLAFKSPEEVYTGIEEINRRYAFHCQAARAIAAEYFDARQVLSHLLERALNAASTAAATS